MLCDINGICEDFEDAESCPSDCGEGSGSVPTTTTVPETEYVCGNDICESGESILTCSEDCTITTTTTMSAVGQITGLFGSMTSSVLGLIIAILMLIVIILLSLKRKVGKKKEDNKTDSKEKKK